MKTKHVFPLWCSGRGTKVSGITDLELFAAMAMQGLCSNPLIMEANVQHPELIPKRLAEAAVENAKALREELDRVMKEHNE